MGCLFWGKSFHCVGLILEIAKKTDSETLKFFFYHSPNYELYGKVSPHESDEAQLWNS